jgi:peptide/nickel transport system substrate-binding protein
VAWSKVHTALAKPRLIVVVALTALASGCSSPAPTALPSSAPVPGGTINIGVWQRPNSFLDAGVVGDLPFAFAIAAPVQEGLLWYRPVEDTSHAASPADYWAPDLAVEVPTVANGDVKTSGCVTAQAVMCVTWKLRQGVRWHDGAAFTSHDVCATAQLYWLKYGAAGQPNPTALRSTGGWSHVLKCTEDDRYTAVIDFSSQYGPYLSLGSGVFGILPASVLDAAFAQKASVQAVQSSFDLSTGSGNGAAFKGPGSLDKVLDGTGPFAFHGVTASGDTVLVKNANYWNSQARPHLDSIVFKAEPDVATALKDAQSGAIDVVFDAGIDSLKALQGVAASAAPVLKVQVVPASGAEKIDLNLCAAAGLACDNPAVHKSEYTADPTIRKAMLLGIDRQAIAQAVAPGMTTVPKDSFMYLGASYLDDPSIPLTRSDQGAANTLLDNVGYTRNPMCGLAPDGNPYRGYKDHSCVVINLGTASDSPTRVAVLGMVRKNLQAVGINVPEPFTPSVPQATLLDSFADGGPLYTHAFDAAMYALSLGVPGEPDSYYATYHADCGGTCPDRGQIPSGGNRGQGMNITGVSDAALDGALDMGRAVIDPTTRTGFYVQAEQRLAAILPEIPLYRQLIVNSLSVRLAGVKNNDLVWDYNSADWFCLSGGNGHGVCQA